MGRFWDKAKILESAKKFSNKTDWRANFPSAYAHAFRCGFLKEATSHMPKKLSKKKYTDSEILKDAQRFATKKEWIKNSRSKYFTAINRGILKEATKHMDTKFSRKTKKQILEIAKKYKTKSEWIADDYNSYVAANKAGWLEEASRHMVRLSQTSLPEQKLAEEIKKIYPNAKTTWFNNKDKQSKYRRFQLDIYIPELRKGIEFNGTYWHSLEGLKRGRPTWTEEELNSYHDIKSNFFKQHNVTIEHVSQADWQKDPNLTILKVLQFLGGNQ